MRSRKTIFNVLSIIASIFGCSVGLYFIDIVILQIIITLNPDDFVTGCICSGKILNMFFTVSADTGYLPEPSDFSIYFIIFTSTTIVGIFAKRKAGRSSSERGPAMKRSNEFFVRWTEKFGRVGMFATVLGVACLALMFGVRSKAAAEEHADRIPSG